MWHLCCRCKRGSKYGYLCSCELYGQRGGRAFTRTATHRKTHGSTTVAFVTLLTSVCWAASPSFFQIATSPLSRSSSSSVSLTWRLNVGSCHSLILSTPSSKPRCPCRCQVVPSKIVLWTALSTPLPVSVSAALYSTFSLLFSDDKLFPLGPRCT